MFTAIYFVGCSIPLCLVYCIYCLYFEPKYAGILCIIAGILCVIEIILLIIYYIRKDKNANTTRNSKSR